jgi:ABC-2 type transport system permease protein
VFTIVRKELADYFTGIRGLIILILVLAVSALSIHAAYYGVRGTAVETGYIFLKLFTTVEEVLPDIMSFPTVVGLFFIPVVGIALGFDTINGERSGGTLSRLVSQPIYRDEVINAKLLANIIIMSTMLAAAMFIIAGVGVRIIGVPPTAEEIARLAIYFLSTVVYGIFWLGLSVLFSVLFRSSGTSLLVLLAIWLLFGIFYIFMIAPGIANAIVPTATETEEVLVRNAELQQALLRVSPSYLFLEASTVLLLPLWAPLGVITLGQMAYMAFYYGGVNPLPLQQSLLTAWPHFVILVSLAAATLAASYVLFMRQEIKYR